MTESHNQPPSDGELREMFERFQGPDSPSPSPVRRRRKRLGLSLALAVPVLVGAAVLATVVHGNRHENSQPTISSGTAAFCAARVNFEGRRYYGGKLGPDDSFERGELLGTGIVPACGDTIEVSVSPDGATTTTKTDTAVDRSVSVYSVIGVSPVDAVMIEGEIDVMYVSDAISDRARREKDCRDARSYSALFDCLKSLP